MEMIKFFKDSVRELKHVVWPTNNETNNFFFTVVIVLVLFGIYLFLASTVFTETLFGLKDIFNQETNITIDGDKDLTNNFSQEVKIKNKESSNTGTVNEILGTGSTIKITE